MTDSATALPESIECPLCLGKGDLSRMEVLERLGMKDFARVAQLSAEEAIRLILEKEKEGEQLRWLKFDAELARRFAELTGRHNAELQKIQAEKAELTARLNGMEASASSTLDNARQGERLKAGKELDEQLTALRQRIVELEAAGSVADGRKKAELAVSRAQLETALTAEKAKANDLSRQTQDYLGEICSLRERNQTLEIEMGKVARIGKKEEMDFADQARSWTGIWVGEKLPRNGDYLMAFSDPAGNPLEPKMVVDNKDKAIVAGADIRKLIRDARERKVPVAVLVTKDESQLRHVDRRVRWGQQDGVWLLRSTRAWLPRDLEVLRPVFERMRAEGPDFLRRNTELAVEVRRTLTDIDEVEDHLGKAGNAIGKAQELTAKYRMRLTTLCDTARSSGTKPTKYERKNGTTAIGNGDGLQEHQQTT